MPLTDVRHMAIEAEYRLQTARAEQGWRAMEAAAARQRRTPTAHARWIVGMGLVVRHAWFAESGGQL